MLRKKRVLFIGEASYIATGFGTYWNEVLKRLHTTDEFEIAEFGSYAKDNDPQIRQVPWKFYPVQPAPNNVEATKVFNSSRTNQFGEWRFPQVCLDFKPDIVCVPPGTNVETENGVKPIEDIEVGEQVLTHKGRMRRVLETMRRQHCGKIIKIYPYNDNICYNFTEEHPILAIQSQKRTWKERDVQQRHKVEDAKFVSAKDLCKGDYVLIPIDRPILGKAFLDVTKYLNQFILDKETNKVYPNGHRNYRHDNGIPKDINITARLARFLGYYCAEGSGNNGSIHLDFHYNEVEYAEDAINLIDDIFGLKAKVLANIAKTIRTVIVNSVLLEKLLKKLSGDNAHNKKVPNCIWKCNDPLIIQSFLEGLIKGDGCYKPDTVSLCTVSVVMARQVRMLFAKLGCKASFCQKTVKANSFVLYDHDAIDIECYGESARIAHSFISKHKNLSTRSNNIPKWKNKGTKGWITHNYIVVPIRRIRTENYKGQVYNLEVDEDNSYVTGFSVHNCGIRDWWMDEFALRSPLRNKFKFLWMPTIDGVPQKEEWLDSYKQCDKILTYSRWGYNVLKKDGRKGTNLITVASPGVDIDVFKPVEDKAKHKLSFGIDSNCFIIGTVMRNQKRKLYYDLIEAFSQWLHKTKTKGHVELASRTFLYLHTSYPDQGWDIGSAMREFNVGNKILMTYLCRNCHATFPTFFSGDITHCKRCGKMSAQPPSANHHVPREILAKIMNVFDLYVQYSISEGFGMPCVEAMGCGVPVAAVRYSAMEDHLEAPGSIPIEVERFFRESVVETEQRRALPNNRDFCNKLDIFIKMKQEKRDDISRKIREYAVEEVETYGSDKKFPRYGWDRTAEIWKNILRQTDISDPEKTWLNPKPQIRKIDFSPPTTSMNNTEFVRWIIGDVWGKPEMAYTNFAGHWIRGLNCGFLREGMNASKMNRQIMADHFRKLIEHENVLEMARVAQLKSANPNQINLETV